MGIGGIGGGFQTSLGGLQDAGQRLNDSARRVAGSSLPRGQSEGDAAFALETFRNGQVDLAAEAVNQKIATYDYKANLKALEISDKMQREVIDILA